MRSVPAAGRQRLRAEGAALTERAVKKVASTGSATVYRSSATSCTVNAAALIPAGSALDQRLQGEYLVTVTRFIPHTVCTLLL
ncbi:MAG: hypothetical protein LBS86_06995 [Treponema sp.]|nr:hypothetical protein [Treponema sp.]